MGANFSRQQSRNTRSSPINKYLYSIAIGIVGFCRYYWYWTGAKPPTISQLCCATENYAIFNAFSVISFLINREVAIDYQESILSAFRASASYALNEKKEKGETHININTFYDSVHSIHSRLCWSTYNIMARLNYITGSFMFLATSLNTGAGKYEILHSIPVALWVTSQSVENYLFYPRLRRLLQFNVLGFLPFLYYLFYKLQRAEKEEERKKYRRKCIVWEYGPIFLLMNYPIIQMMIDIYNGTEQRVVYGGVEGYYNLSRVDVKSPDIDPMLMKDDTEIYIDLPVFANVFESFWVTLVMFPEYLLDWNKSRQTKRRMSVIPLLSSAIKERN